MREMSPAKEGKAREDAVVWLLFGCKGKVVKEGKGRVRIGKARLC